MYFLATSVFSPSSFTKIFNAKCSISLKSIIFFSFFFLANSDVNSKINLRKASRILYIADISSFASLELYCKIAPLNSFFILSRISFASFFSSKVTFLSTGHLLHEIPFIVSNAKSQLSYFILCKLFISS